MTANSTIATSPLATSRQPARTTSATATEALLTNTASTSFRNLTTSTLREGLDIIRRPNP